MLSGFECFLYVLRRIKEEQTLAIADGCRMEKQNPKAYKRTSRGSVFS